MTIRAHELKKGDTFSIAGTLYRVLDVNSKNIYYKYITKGGNISGYIYEMGARSNARVELINHTGSGNRQL